MRMWSGLGSDACAEVSDETHAECCRALEKLDLDHANWWNVLNLVLRDTDECFCQHRHVQVYIHTRMPTYADAGPLSLCWSGDCLNHEGWWHVQCDEFLAHKARQQLIG
jgi:hypothetical protein